MKHSWLKSTIMLPALLAVHSMAQANVLITEYVEGSSNNKAVEISNLGSSTVDLSDYKLFRVANGNTDSTDSESFTGISLDAGASYVLYNNSATAAFKEAPNSASSSLMSHNGDDSFELRTGAGSSSTTGVLVDSIGQAGNDDNYSVNETLRRNDNITTGDTDQTDAWSSAAEWTSFASDTADGLGCPGITDCASYVPPTPPTPGGEVLITEIVNGTGSNKVIEISNTTSATIDLADGRYKLQVFLDDGNNPDPLWPDEQVFLKGSLPAGASLVVYNSGAAADFKKAAPIGLAGGSVTSFTGNDAIVLLKGTGEEIVDSFGQVGASDVIISATATLRRKATVLSGNTSATDIFNTTQADEWAVELVDDFAGLGCPGVDDCTGAEPTASTGNALDNVGICFNCDAITPVFDITNYDFNTYYINALAEATGDKAAFRAALNQDISANYNQLTYGEVWSALTYTDEDPLDSDNVIMLYTGRSIFKQQNGSGDQSNNQDYWNREHVWAKSRGFPSSSQLGYTDIHHLRPADISINSARSNFDFANGGDPVDGTTNKLVSGLSWEPRDEVKGDVARMMFYMVVRYETGEVDMPDLELVDKAGENDFNSGDDTANFGKLCDLYEWHKSDPVSDFEINRNNRIHEYQGNRNPFIDKPEWVAIAFKNTCEFEVTPISFADKIDVALSTTITSETQTVTGFADPKVITITGGEYSLGCNGTFTDQEGTISADTDICLRHQSASEYSTLLSNVAATTNTVVTIDEFDFTFTSITSRDPSNPDNEFPVSQTPQSFKFVAKNNVAVNTVITSGTTQITGLQAGAVITISNGEYSIGCNSEFSKAQGLIENGESVCIRHTSSSSFGTSTTSTLKIGGVSASFVSTTAAESFKEADPVVDVDNSSADDADAVGGMGYWLILLASILSVRRRRTMD